MVTIAKARRAKNKLVELVNPKLELAVGLSRGTGGGGYFLAARVKWKKDIRKIPTSFDGVIVVTQAVGKIRALTHP